MQYLSLYMYAVQQYSNITCSLRFAVACTLMTRLLLTPSRALTLNGRALCVAGVEFVRRTRRIREIALQVTNGGQLQYEVHTTVDSVLSSVLWMHISC